MFAGYYGDARDGGTCVLCSGHSVGTVQRGAAIPGDEVGATFPYHSPTSVAVSGSGAVLALGFSDALVGGIVGFGAVRVYAWDGVAWEQRGDDVVGGAANGGFGTTVALSEDGNVVSGGAPFVDTVVDDAGAIYVFVWDGALWSLRGDPILGEQEMGSIGLAMGLNALGSELVAAEFYEMNGDRVSRAFVYAWDAGTSEWVVRGAPLVGSAASGSYGISVGISSDGDVVAIGSSGPSGPSGPSGANGTDGTERHLRHQRHQRDRRPQRPQRRGCGGNHFRVRVGVW